MGVIQRQSIKQSVINYLAVGIGAISMMFIYPLDKAAYGLARFVIDTAQMMAPLILMGFGAVAVRYFPTFKEEGRGGQGGFLFLLLSAATVGALVFALLSVVFREQFYSIFAEKEPIYRQFLPYLVPLAILIAFLQLFTAYCSNFQRIAIPAIFQNLIKLSLPILILLYVWGKLEIGQVVNGILVNFILALAGVVIYVHGLGQLKFRPDPGIFRDKRGKGMGAFAVFSLFSAVGSVLAFSIDSFMITALLDFESNGVYNIALFIANVIAIPNTAVGQISGPIIADSLMRNDLPHLKKLYQDTSINLLVVGLLLFVCIVASVEDLFSMMPKSEELQGAFAVVFFIGLAKVIDMGTSINNQIINYSKHYRFGFVAILLLAVLNISANLWLIPRYHIAGAAAATLFSLTVFNLAKMLFIKWHFQMLPFTWKSLWIALIAAASYLAAVSLPASGVALFDMLAKSVVATGLYLALVFYFNISPVFQETLLKVVRRKGL